jgi:uncharacterized membrane protein YfcA|tara:strand:- start:2547 stop:3341 length:795 start_codon:yes stop_codon:yes gene_type:complete
MHDIKSYYELLFIIVLLSAFLNAILGFGFAIIFSPVFIAFLEPNILIQVSGLLTLLVVFILSIFLFKFCNYKLLFKSILFSLPAYPVGYLFISEVNSIFIKIIALAVVFLSIKNIIYSEFKNEIITYDIKAKSDLKSISNKNYFINFLAPFFAGFLNQTLAMPGPAIIGFYRKFNLDQNTLKATLAAFMTVSYSILMISQFFFIGISNQTFSIVKMFFIPVSIGLILGFFFNKKISEKFYLKVTLVVLFSVLISLIINIFNSIS